MLLVSGCSYLENNFFSNLFYSARCNGENITCLARSGAGNQYIADSVLNNLNQQVTDVFVLWTGFNRIDISMSSDINLEIIKPWHKTQVGHTTWLHSGGMQGGLSLSELPPWVDSYLKYQYLPLDWNYLIDQNLRHVVGCLNTLKKLDINYSFGFIYDIHQDYSKRFFLGGAVPRDHYLLKAIDWSKCISITPYEYCLTNNLLSADDFHPSDDGYQIWWNQIQKELPFQLT
jgi:hypothetical protein